MLIRAKVARDVIPEELRAAGAQVDVVEAYETVVPEKSRARLRELMKNAARRPHIVTFTSSSSAKNFAELLGKVKAGSLSTGLLKNVQFASIGPVTSATLGELQMPATIEAREFTMGGLIRAIVLARYAEPSDVEIAALAVSLPLPAESDALQRAGGSFGLGCEIPICGSIASR